MQTSPHPLAQLLRQLSALGSFILVQGQRKSTADLGPSRPNTSAIMLTVVIAFAPPLSTSALCAANDNQGD